MTTKIKKGVSANKAASPLRTIATDHERQITALCFLHGGRFLVSGSFDATIRLWNVYTTDEVGKWTMKPKKWGVTALACSPDGYTLAALSKAEKGSGKDRPQPLFMNLVGNVCREFTEEERVYQRIEGIAVSPASDIVALGGEKIYLYDINSWDMCGAPLDNSYDADLLAFLGGQRLLSAHSNGVVKTWDLSTRACVENRSDHEGCVTALTASTNGSWAASADDTSISIWDTADPGNDQRLTGKWEHTDSLTILPDNQTLLSLHDVNDKAMLRIWSLAEGKQIGRWKPKTGLLGSVAVSQDGTRLAAARLDHLIEVWDMQAILRQL